nr:MAG TPA: hypothetical protein [Caudoviricetes sp.]
MRLNRCCIASNRLALPPSSLMLLCAFLIVPDRLS